MLTDILTHDKLVACTHTAPWRVEVVCYLPIFLKQRLYQYIECCHFQHHYSKAGAIRIRRQDNSCTVSPKFLAWHQDYSTYRWGYDSFPLDHFHKDKTLQHVDDSACSSFAIHWERYLNQGMLPPSGISSSTFTRRKHDSPYHC